MVFLCAQFLLVYRYLDTLGGIKIIAFGQTAKFLGFCFVFEDAKYPGTIPA